MLGLFSRMARRYLLDTTLCDFLTRTNAHPQHDRGLFPDNDARRQDWAADRRAGTGIVFVKDRYDDLYVNLLVKGGPAHLSGIIRQGCVLNVSDVCRPRLL